MVNAYLKGWIGFLSITNVKDYFPVGEVANLVRSGLDCAPLLMQCSTIHEQVVKLFRFLNFSLKEDSCIEVIK